MNVFNAILPVYAAYIFSAALTMGSYLLTQSHFLIPVEKISLLLGITTYSFVLFFVSMHANRLGRFAVAHRLKREKTLSLLRRNHLQEIHLREKLEEERAQLAEANRQLSELARNDPLTALYNRRYLMEQLDRELSNARRHETIFSIVLLDIDDFKRINDTCGHQVGDKVLIALSGRLASKLREIDFLARWGGEEFICLLPRCPGEEAVICAERLREALAAAPLLPEHPELRVSASFGVACYRGEDDADSIVKRADDALYTAKSSGKNKVFPALEGHLVLFPHKTPGKASAS